MVKELTTADAGDSTPVTEQPPIWFREFAIALQFQLGEPRGAPTHSMSTRSDDHFWSFERDLLAAAFQDTNQVRSRLIPLTDRQQRVSVSFSEPFQYVAEGCTKSLYSKDCKGPVIREFGLQAAVTEFHTGVKVLHVILKPVQKINQYDIVKLTKLWQAGEETGPGERHDAQKQIAFRFGESGSLHSIDEVVESVCSLDADLSRVARRSAKVHSVRRPSGGVIQLIDDSDSLDEPFAWIADESKSKRITSDELGQQLRALEGMLCGLLDFQFIDDEELLDVFAEGILKKDGLYLAIHKGTLFYATKACRVYTEVRDDIGISPYLLLPQAVLIHNEVCLQRASEDVIASAMLEERSQRFDVYQKHEQQIRYQLQHNIMVNLFHYPTEREIFRVGTASRGLFDLQLRLDAQHQHIAAIANRLNEVSMNLQSSMALAVGMVGLLLAAIQVMTSYEAIDKFVYYVQLGRMWALIPLGLMAALFAIWWWMWDILRLAEQIVGAKGGGR